MTGARYARDRNFGLTGAELRSRESRSSHRPDGVPISRPCNRHHLDLAHGCARGDLAAPAGSRSEFRPIPIQETARARRRRFDRNLAYRAGEVLYGYPLDGRAASPAADKTTQLNHGGRHREHPGDRAFGRPRASTDGGRASAPAYGTAIWQARQGNGGRAHHRRESSRIGRPPFSERPARERCRSRERSPSHSRR